eukprot:5995986-Amphidinium_carterae.2
MNCTKLAKHLSKCLSCTVVGPQGAKGFGGSNVVEELQPHAADDIGRGGHAPMEQPWIHPAGRAVQRWPYIGGACPLQP